MAAGLGLAESTPGPLIMVTEFVGFLAAYQHPGTLSPAAAGVLGALVATWATFAPCFLWIFLGAPYVEVLRKDPRLTGALTAVIDDQLTGERRVGHRFLVTGHARREDDLADGMRLCATPVAVEARAVLEQEVSVFARHQMISFWTDLNSGVPARSSSSNSAASTVPITAPAPSRRSRPRS